MSVSRTLVALVLIVPALAAPVGASTLDVTPPARVTALAVSVNETGDLVGSSASIEVRVADDGSGHVFMDTRPLSGTDMQGSARIAARVASGLTGHGVASHDFFYTVRSDTSVISGPSAGAVMSLAASVALQNAHLEADERPWEIREDVMATGTINPDGSIGPVGGILQKAEEAEKAGASVFVVPEGQGNYTPRLPPEQAEHGEAPVNVASFCERELNISCPSVGTIQRLVEIATDRQLPQAERGAAPTTERYADVLGPRTREIVDRAERVWDTWDRFNGSDLPTGARAVVNSSIQEAVNATRQANDLWESQRFYSAASKAFQAAIQERHARLTLEFYDRGSSFDFLKATVSHAAQDVRAAEDAAREAEVTGLHTLYTVGAGQERVSDAERRIDQAWQALNGTAPASQTLLQASWAFERSRTVHWWLELSEPFGSGPALPESTETLANEFINLGRELIAYSGSVVGGGQGPGQARQVLDRAQQDQDRGFHAAALVEAAEAQVLASQALETRGGEPTTNKVNASRQQAAISIQKARGLGVEPILPVAMFEFASTNEDPTISLRFYRTANVLAGISSVLTAEQDPSPSRFVDPVEDSDGGHAAPGGQIVGPQLSVAGWALVGVFATLAAATGTLALVKHRSEAD